MGLGESVPLDPNRFQSNQQVDRVQLFADIFGESSWYTCRTKIRQYLIQGNSFTSLYQRIQEDLSQIDQENTISERDQIRRAYLVLHEIDQHIKKGRATLYQLISNIFAWIFLRPSYWSVINQVMSSEQSMIHSILSSALEIANGMNGIEDVNGNWKEQALIVIATEQAKTNMGQALELANEIENGYWKVKALIAVAAELAKTNVGQALELANGMGDASNKEEVFSAIAKEQAKTNVERALETANGIETKYWKARALIAIAKEQAKTN